MAHRAVLISVSLTLGQTSDYDAKPWMWGKCKEPKNAQKEVKLQKIRPECPDTTKLTPVHFTRLMTVMDQGPDLLNSLRSSYDKIYIRIIVKQCQDILTNYF